MEVDDDGGDQRTLEEPDCKPVESNHEDCCSSLQIPDIRVFLLMLLLQYRGTRFQVTDWDIVGLDLETELVMRTGH